MKIFGANYDLFWLNYANFDQSYTIGFQKYLFTTLSLVLAQGLILVSEFQTSSAMDKVHAVKKSVLRQI